MPTVTIASDEADARAVEAIETHHAELAVALMTRVNTLIRANDETFAGARAELARWCHAELLPHAAAEEDTIYAAGAQDERTRLLVRAMSDEHVVLGGLVDRIEASQTPTDAAAAATALRVLFETHIAKENDLLLPTLASSAAVSVAGLLGAMHEAMAHAGVAHDPAPAARAAAGGHACGCGGHDDAEPELDARTVPHAIRHATIFGALGALPVGGAMVLVAPHDPLPLLAQLEDGAPGMYAIEYVERGPDAWRLRFTRERA